MTKDSRKPDISIQELKTGMMITAYTSFDKKYAPLDEETCEWVKHNFKGAAVRGTRSGDRFLNSIANLLPGDHIQEIFDIPATLKNICQVNDGLISELKKRGFLHFRVQLPATDSSDEPSSRSAAVSQASQLLENIKESLSLCQHASTAVESLMDDASDDAPNFKEVQDCVGKMSTDETLQAVSAIMSLKENDHIYSHCVDVGVIFQQVYYPIIKKRGEESAFKDKQEAMLAAFLHDIGKARVPKEILTSTKLFKQDSQEIQEIRKHTEFGAQLLSEAGMPEVIVNMARYHHVKLDETMSSSYPKSVSQAEAAFETRLLSIIDTYQALVSGRSYKKSWTPAAVIRYLDAIAGIEFDLDLWTSFQEVMGYYPIGSLVRLSDNSQAFVINVPKKNLLNPHIAVVMEADGQRPAENRFIDLAQEKTLTIQEDLDASDVFKENAFSVFSGLNIV